MFYSCEVNQSSKKHCFVNKILKFKLIILLIIRSRNFIVIYKVKSTQDKK